VSVECIRRGLRLAVRKGGVFPLNSGVSPNLVNAQASLGFECLPWHVQLHRCEVVGVWRSYAAIFGADTVNGAAVCNLPLVGSPLTRGDYQLPPSLPRKGSGIGLRGSGYRQDRVQHRLELSRL
jgi:hypothetical protein